ncbi:hypothetical protein [Ruegeria jejuensis]|uniref:hypothetical protein n=1 Tax=Ruegeria jejuensis TaxID=3233338 RepID=UPI00355B6FB1
MSIVEFTSSVCQGMPREAMRPDLLSLEGSTDRTRSFQNEEFDPLASSSDPSANLRAAWGMSIMRFMKAYIVHAVIQCKSSANIPA